jgi:hypothetical protein
MLNEWSKGWFITFSAMSVDMGCKCVHVNAIRVARILLLSQQSSYLVLFVCCLFSLVFSLSHHLCINFSQLYQRELGHTISLHSHFLTITHVHAFVKEVHPVSSFSIVGPLNERPAIPAQTLGTEYYLRGLDIESLNYTLDITIHRVTLRHCPLSSNRRSFRPWMESLNF